MEGKKGRGLWMRGWKRPMGFFYPSMQRAEQKQSSRRESLTGAGAHRGVLDVEVNLGVGHDGGG